MACRVPGVRVWHALQDGLCLDEKLDNLQDNSATASVIAQRCGLTLGQSAVVTLKVSALRKRTSYKRVRGNRIEPRLVGTSHTFAAPVCSYVTDLQRTGILPAALSTESQDCRITGPASLVEALRECGNQETAALHFPGLRRGGAAPADLTALFGLQLAQSAAEGRRSIQKESPREAVLAESEGTCFPGDCRTGNVVNLRLPHRDSFSWTSLISKLTKHGQGRQALKIYEEMRAGGVQLSSYTFVAALKACSSVKDLETTRKIHVELVKSGFESDKYVGTMLVDVYSKCGSLVDARLVFERMHHRDVVAWNAMIFGYAQMEEGEMALDLYSQMQQEGIVPDDRTLVGALRACSSLATVKEVTKSHEMISKRRWLERVRVIHSDAVKWQFESDIFVGTMLVDVYSKCGSLVDARRVFEKMPRRDVAAWNAMILGYAQMDEGEESLHLYKRMRQEGVLADDRTFVGALKACSSLVAVEDKNKADRRNVDQRCIDTVRAIHSDIVQVQYKSDLFVGTMLVDVYAKCGSLVDARRVFEKMPYRNVVSWNAMILGYAQMEDGEEALQLYALMQEEGLVPNEGTFVGALKACGLVAGLELGKEVHAQICKSGFMAGGIFVPTCLIDMYGKCGSMVDAQQVFDSLPTRDIVTWSALIAGYAHVGDSEVVFNLFHKMKQEGIQPNGVTFVSVLTACSHAGLVDTGQMYFDAMSTDFGVTPTIDHYICMVDLLGRAGRLAAAMEMVKIMPYRPNSAVWRTILGACKKWSNLEFAKQAFDCAVRLDRKDAAAYVLMSNIYAAAQMWDAVKEMKVLRVKTKAWKQPGQSRWTDLSGIVHAFAVGDREHPESRDVYAKVQDLVVRMKQVGYVPHLESVLHDIPDDEKEDALCGHSEKLAIAYALMKTPEGTTIRVVKNLRVCEDCHNATAVISKIEHRTIICRDASRFHVYKDGKCSCRDYW